MAKSEPQISASSPIETGSSSHGGAFEAKLGHYLALTYSERDALRWLERRERTFEAGSIVVREGEETPLLHIVASGWLHGSKQLRTAAARSFASTFSAI